MGEVIDFILKPNPSRDLLQAQCAIIEAWAQSMIGFGDLACDIVSQITVPTPAGDEGA